MFPSDIYFDGKTVTAIAIGKKFYAQQPAAGPGLDTFAKERTAGCRRRGPILRTC